MSASLPSPARPRLRWLGALAALLLLCLTVAPSRAWADAGRSQVCNDSSHNLAVLTLYKKAQPGTAASLGVLAPGHETDDDYSVVALVVPPEVSLQWGEAGQEAADTTGRLLPLPEGTALRVSDPTPEAAAASGDTPQASAEPGPVAYALNLPPVALERSLPDGSTAPALSQADLDAEAESAPLD